MERPSHDIRGVGEYGSQRQGHARRVHLTAVAPAQQVDAAQGQQRGHGNGHREPLLEKDDHQYRHQYRVEKVQRGSQSAGYVEVRLREQERGGGIEQGKAGNDRQLPLCDTEALASGQQHEPYQLGRYGKPVEYHRVDRNPGLQGRYGKEGHKSECGRRYHGINQTSDRFSLLFRHHAIFKHLK